GSWAWVKKRPRQLLNFAGLFNPQMKHRHARVLRRHILLLDFMLAAALNSNNWLPDKQQAALLTQTAQSLWFS
ncbi:MAG TPA: zinc carboxypeptidase, partial [Cellvibrio sp.]|nr:zinc carboxypeptidase [Cellvibrio sp.]